MAEVSASASTKPSTPEERARAAEIEARAVALSSKVRCLECGHQSIEESGADIAVLLRKVIRDELRKGKSEKQVEEKLTEDYGESILYAPKFDFQSSLLYLMPVLLLAGAGVTVATRRPLFRFRLRAIRIEALVDDLTAGIPLSDLERRALYKLMDPPPEGARVVDKLHEIEEE